MSLKLYSQRIKELRLKHKMSQLDLAKAINLESRSTISMYENGKREPDLETFEAIADIFNVPLSYLMGDKNSHVDPYLNEIYKLKNVIPMSSMKEIPLIGSIACGQPITAFDDTDLGTVSCPANINADFALICKGDSMIEASIFDGDIVYILKQSSVDNGAIAAVRIDGEATLKRVYISDNNIILAAENKKYKPIVLKDFSEDDDISIIGKATHFTTKIR